MAKGRLGLTKPARSEGARRGELATLGLLARGARFEDMAGADALEDAETGSEAVAMYGCECECECWSLSDQHALGRCCALDRRADREQPRRGWGGRRGDEKHATRQDAARLGGRRRPGEKSR